MRFAILFTSVLLLFADYTFVFFRKHDIYKFLTPYESFYLYI